jgi:hypothetical protein
MDRWDEVTNKFEGIKTNIIQLLKEKIRKRTRLTNDTEKSNIRFTGLMHSKFINPINI